MVTRTGRMIAFYVRKFSGSWQENLQNDGLRAIVKRHGTGVEGRVLVELSFTNKDGIC